MKKYKLFHFDGEEIGWVELSGEERDSLEGLDIPFWCLRSGRLIRNSRDFPLTDSVFVMEEVG
jgi:hypothetical protein